MGETHYLRGIFPRELDLKISGTVDTNTPGVYTVQYLVTYKENGAITDRTYTGYSKLVVIVEG